jgi:hypothetical protein
MQIFVKTFIDMTPYPRLAGCSNDKFPPRTTSFRLARELSATPPTTCSHEKSPPPTTRSHEQFSSPTKAGPTHGGRSAGPGAAHERGAAPTFKLRRNDTQGFVSPHHANTPSSEMRGRPALTSAVRLHCSSTQPLTRHPVQPLQPATPVRTSIQLPSIGSTYLHLGCNVAGLNNTQGS